jgi:hypothetical protein
MSHPTAVFAIALSPTRALIGCTTNISHLLASLYDDYPNLRLRRFWPVDGENQNFDAAEVSALLVAERYGTEVGPGLFELPSKLAMTELLVALDAASGGYGHAVGESFQIRPPRAPS